jgi:hypothetical protein
MLMLALLMNRRFRTAAALAVISGLGLACGGKNDPQAGVLVVPYELGNHKDCSSLGVKVVRAELDDPMFVEEALCDSGEVRFEQVPPGSYHVRLFGIDRSGIAVMDSLQERDLGVNVVGNGTTVVADPAIMLTAAPARLMLRWNFGFGTCDSAGVDRFAVTAWRSDGSALLLDTEVSCKLVGQGAEQYRSVPDLQRQLAGDELGEVNIQPLDKNGVEMGQPTTFNFAAPGPGHNVMLSVTCSEGGCKGSGTLD